MPKKIHSSRFRHSYYYILSGSISSAFDMFPVTWFLFPDSSLGRKTHEYIKLKYSIRIKIDLF